MLSPLLEAKGYSFSLMEVWRFVVGGGRRRGGEVEGGGSTEFFSSSSSFIIFFFFAFLLFHLPSHTLPSLRSLLRRRRHRLLLPLLSSSTTISNLPSLPTPPPLVIPPITFAFPPIIPKGRALGPYDKH